MKNSFPSLMTKVSELKKQYPISNIITHTDMDGYCSGALAYKILHNCLKYEAYNINVTHMSPSDPIEIQPGLTIITDLSLTSADNLNRVLEASQKEEICIFWIDHHQSSVDQMLDLHDKIKNDHDRNIKGGYMFFLLDTRRSATILTSNVFKTLYKNLIFFNSDMSMSQLVCDCGFCILKERIMTVVNKPDQYLSIPIMADIVDQWDRFDFRWKDSDDEYLAPQLNQAFYNCSNFIKDVRSPFYDLLNFTYVDCGYKYFELDKMPFHNEVLNYLLQYGKKSLIYGRYFYLKDLLKYGFIGKLRKFDRDNFKFTDETIADIIFICCNRGSQNMGDACPDLLEKYHFGINFHIDLKGYEHTIYYRGPEDKDFGAGKVCELFGGGGHPGCGGFVLPTTPIVPFAPLSEDMKEIIQKKIDELECQMAPCDTTAIDELLNRTNK